MDSFLRTLGEGTDCTAIDGGALSIVTPFVTVDGDNIEVIVQQSEDGSEVTVSDFGESTRYLANYGIDFGESAIRQDYLKQIQSTMAVQFGHGRVSVTLPSSEVGNAVLRVVEASRFICDLVYTGRSREENEFRSEVKSALTQISREVREGKHAELRGRSGKKYDADFYASNDYGAWVDLITGMRRTSFNNKLFYARTMFSDTLDSVRKLSIIDDVNGLADESDFKLMSEVSSVARWSNLPDLREKLEALTVTGHG